MANLTACFLSGDCAALAPFVEDIADDCAGQCTQRNANNHFPLRSGTAYVGVYGYYMDSQLVQTLPYLVNELATYHTASEIAANCTDTDNCTVPAFRSIVGPVGL